MHAWRQVAALLVFFGGFADAGLAHPDRLDALDLVLFGTGLSSAILFLSLGAITRSRLLLLIGGVAVASAVAVVLDAARGLTVAEVVIAATDVTLRLALAACLAVLAYRHVRPDHRGA